MYKLVADDHGPKLKLAEGKATFPGRKQIHRTAEYDVLCLDGEPCEGRTLLAPVVESGRRLAPPSTLEELQSRCAAAVAALPPRLHSLDPAAPPYEATVRGTSDGSQ